MTQVPVLDHGYLSLIESWGSDERVVESARMSTGKGFNGWGTPEEPGDEKLLKYLHKNKHSTPFEMAGMTIEVKAPIFVFREWHRHRTFCLSGNAQLIFERPCDGKSYPMKLSDVFRKWNPPAAKRRRKDQSLLSLAEHNRLRMSSMKLRCPEGAESITDAWDSGEKDVYTVVTKYGEVTVSADHLFKTPDGQGRISDGLKTVMAMASVGDRRSHSAPVCTGAEEWREVMDGLDVSSHGRARSYLRQGVKTKQSEPVIKTITINGAGRAVVSFNGKPYQVSKLVAKAFGIAGDDDWVLHVNDNPMDNRVENLKAGDVLENTKDKYVNGGQKKLRCVPVDVVEVRNAGREMTYDISVTGDHWFLANNLVVHNSYSEASARYIPLPDENYVPSIDRVLRGANIPTSNRQAQGMGDVVLTPEAAGEWLSQLKCLYDHCEQVYKAGLSIGVPKELARLAVPVARYSRMRASGNLRNWLAFLVLRKAKAAQFEIREYADEVGNVIAKTFPRTWELFMEEFNQ